MRDQSIAADRRREREQWQADRQLLMRMREEQSAEIVRLDSSLDELRRERHHATRPAQ